MWLTMHQKILTKDTLTKKGWVGNNQCQFCPANETRDHIFLTCPLAQQIWLWLGKSQIVMTQWHTWKYIFQYAISLPKHESVGLLVVLSVVCWILWKHINGICFNDNLPKTARTIIFLIKSLIDYWAGKMKKKVAEAAQLWMPVIEDVITLNVIPPNMEMVPYTDPGDMEMVQAVAPSALTTSG